MSLKSNHKRVGEIKAELKEFYEKQDLKQKQTKEKLVRIDELSQFYGISIKVENINKKSLEEIEHELHSKYGNLKYEKATIIIQKWIR